MKEITVEPVPEDCKEYQELLEHLNKVHDQVEKGETNEFVELEIKEKTQ